MSAAAPCVSIVGPQGAGKGTQAARLALAMDIDHVSTGDVLRRPVADADDLGRMLAAYVTTGDLVPDELMVDLVRKELGNCGADRGHVLDGFPRTVGQAVAYTAAFGVPPDVTIEIEVPFGELLDRLTRRRVCMSCAAIVAAPAGYVDVVPCPDCGAQAVRRVDDTPAIIAHRLAQYDQHALPLKCYLRSSGRVVTVDGSGSPSAVHSRILSTLRSQFPARGRLVSAALD